jgi:hypothetical protein
MATLQFEEPEEFEAEVTDDVIDAAKEQEVLNDAYAKMALVLPKLKLLVAQTSEIIKEIDEVTDKTGDLLSHESDDAHILFDSIGNSLPYEGDLNEMITQLEELLNAPIPTIGADDDEDDGEDEEDPEIRLDEDL